MDQKQAMPRIQRCSVNWRGMAHSGFGRYSFGACFACDALIPSPDDLPGLPDLAFEPISLWNRLSEAGFQVFDTSSDYTDLV